MAGVQVSVCYSPVHGPDNWAQSLEVPLRRDQVKLLVILYLGCKVLCLHFVLFHFFFFNESKKYYFLLPRDNESVHSMTVVSMRK